MKIRINKITIYSIIIGLILIVILGLSIRGNIGNPNSTDLLSSKWQLYGPFELSPERGRFALLYSIVEDKSFYYSIPIARFVVPDLGLKNGHYVSLFAPAISFLLIPGYLIGKILGASQVGATAVISLFALVNMYLIYRISLRLGCTRIIGVIAGLTFLFATPAFTYAVTIYQHHVSTLLILLAVTILLEKTSLISLFLVWFLCAMSIPVDYPNLFLMLPIGVMALKRFYNITDTKTAFKITLHIRRLATVSAVIIPLLFFLWFNYQSYGNALQLSGTVSTVKAIDNAGKPTNPDNTGSGIGERYTNPESQDKSAIRYFKPRNIINGLYIHLISPDRGMIRYTPVILLGIGGLYYITRRNKQVAQISIGVILADILLYSMWGDPWGGWAFGSRYMIPAYAILSIGLAVLLDSWKKSKLFILLFFIPLVYSICVNSLGALTTSSNPPKVEVLAIEKISGHEEKYTYARNIQYLLTSGTKSFAYQTWFSHNFSPIQYYWIVTSLIIIVFINLLTIIFFQITI